jgi:protein Mpv17
MSAIWARYNAMLDAQPLLTKALTSLTGFTAGDILAQCFIETGDKPYDVMRTVRMGSFGFLLHGTTGHYFYGMLDSKLPGTAPMTVATKVAIDQTIWNPIFGLMFFGYLNLMEGKSLNDYTNKIKSDLKTAVMGSWAVWVPYVILSSLLSLLFFGLAIFFSLLTHIIFFFQSLFFFDNAVPTPSTLRSSRHSNVCSTLTPFRLVTMSFFRSSETRQWNQKQKQRRSSKENIFIIILNMH